MTLDADTREISSFRSWTELLTATRHQGYVPTVPPESPAHKRVRRALIMRGVRVFPPALLKITGLTPTQSERLEDQLHRLKESGDWGRMLRGAKLTSTTVTMSRDLAEAIIEDLLNEKGDAMDLAFGSVECFNDYQAEFASRSVERSYDALIRKIEKGINHSLR